MTGNVAGTLAIPTVTPFLESIDQIGSSFSMFVLAVIPPTTNPVTPCSSGLVLVNRVLYTRGQFGADTVRSLPYAPLFITLDRLGILPCRSRGRITSSSMPFTPITTTWGLGLASLWATPDETPAKTQKDIANPANNMQRFKKEDIVHL